LGRCLSEIIGVKKRIKIRAILPLAAFIRNRPAGVLGRLTFLKSTPASGNHLFFETQAYFNFKDMGKIKEGVVMTVQEKAEFDRVNTLPRKASGSVAYYFKPQTKFPPRRIGYRQLTDKVLL
jgi:hypothetical protein